MGLGRMLRAGLLAAAGMALALGLAAGQASAAGKLRVIFITHGQAGDPYWNAIKNGLAEAAKVYDADVRYEAPDTFDMSAMSKMIDAAVATRPDGLVVSIPDADALKAAEQ